MENVKALLLSPAKFARSKFKKESNIKYFNTNIRIVNKITYPLSTKTEVYSFRPIRTNKSSTEVGMPLLPLRLMVLTLLAHRWSGSTSTLINLKWPNLPWHLPRQIPDAFIDITSIKSPFWKCTQINGKFISKAIFNFNSSNCWYCIAI